MIDDLAHYSNEIARPSFAATMTTTMATMDDEDEEDAARPRYAAEPRRRIIEDGVDDRGTFE